MKCTNNVNVYANAYETCLNLGKYLGEIADNIPSGEKKNIALSGGNTPKILFSLFKTVLFKHPWNRLNIFFTDERIVPVESVHSNFGEFCRLSGLNNGKRTSLDIVDSILADVPSQNGLPRFDIIVLGIGDDGHTASIFKDNLESFDSQQIVELTENPNNGAQRVTLTGSVINNASEIIFLCTGSNKSKIVDSIYLHKGMSYPAAHVKPVYNLQWFLDKEAFSTLESSSNAIENLSVNY